MNSDQRSRSRIVLAGIVLSACGIALTLYGIQVVRGDEYANKARSQYVRPSASLFDRGSIFFSAKDGSRPAAATLTTSYVVYMSPQFITDPSGTYDAISHYLDYDRDVFMKKAALPEDPYEELADKVSPEVALSIAALRLPGVGVTKETFRSYPGGVLAAQTLGLIGEREGKVEGRYGLESIYEDVLSRPTQGTGANAFAQLFTGSPSFLFGNDSSDHGDIVTTIEPTVQGYLEKILDKTSQQWNADEIGGIIMDPKTGDVIGSATLPSFDPNDTSTVSRVSLFSNPLVESAYEMGSIMKPLTVAVGIDTGVITAESTYDDTGTLTLSGKKISNFDGKARGRVTIQEILSQSLNVGAATVALKIGKDDFSTYFTSLGFGMKTGIDQPNETAGLTAGLKTGRDIEIATMAYGQGIAVSPIAMTRALSVLANDGLLVRPHIVDEIDYADGSKKPTDPGEPVRVLRSESVEQVTRMLVKVVDEALRNGALKLPGYSVAAKTGTAQIPDPATKGYYGDRYLHSFFGYFPAYEPKFIVFLYHKHPKGAQYASETLAEPFAELTKFLIDYYNIPPDR